MNKPKFYIQNFADIGKDYGTFDSIKSAIAECEKWGYNIVRVEETTVWIKESPSL